MVFTYHATSIIVTSGLRAYQITLNYRIFSSWLFSEGLTFQYQLEVG